MKADRERVAQGMRRIASTHEMQARWHENAAQKIAGNKSACEWALLYAEIHRFAAAALIDGAMALEDDDE